MQLKQDEVIKSLSEQVQVFAVSNIVIKTADEYQAAGDQLKQVKSALAQIEAQRVKYTKPLLESQRAINADAKSAAEPWEKAERGIKQAMVGYQNEQERIRREEQRKADEAARKERERIAAQAARAEAAGKTDKAEQLQERAAMVVAPIVQREAPKVAGVSFREVWKFEVTDPKLIPREYLIVDEKKIGGVVRALKDDTQIPGIRVYSEKQMAAGVA